MLWTSQPDPLSSEARCFIVVFQKTLLADIIIRDVHEKGYSGIRHTIQEANYLNSLATEADPTQQFAKRASLREAYHDLCSQFAGDAEPKETTELIEHLGKYRDDVDRSFMNVGAGGKELAAAADSLLSMASVLLEQMKSFRSSNSERIVTATSLAEALFGLLRKVTF
ncbi:hypothetical protein GCK32_006079 [Trichostrongylus colubriformis]|uniref:Uncharacterized protein n=1 Tax=Trichostrongylus colubriformis TaxID=6319 RepID=A0AAN8F6U8_TRICO